MADIQDRYDVLKAERDRYVALAFCGADVLLELDADLNVQFSAGATEVFFGRKRPAMQGVNVRDLIAPVDLPLWAQLLKEVRTAGRFNDEIVRIVGPQDATLRIILSAYTIDQNVGVIYVGVRRLTSAGKALALNVKRDESSGLYDSGDFAELAANRAKRLQSTGEEALVTMLSIPAMAKLKDQVDPKSGESMLRQVSDLLRANSLGGDTVAKVTDDRFTVVHGADTNLEAMTAQIQGLVKSADPEADTAIESATIVMESDSSYTEEDLAKGLLYVMTHMRDASGESLDLKNMAGNMTNLVDKARNEVASFKRMVARSQFFVALQPIIAVNSGDVHHYEALCRFERNAQASPFETITFAEETGLIHEFDLAMARKVVEWMAKMPRNSDKYHVAVNVSGYSISKKQEYVEPLLQMLEENEWTQGRLMFEITESARMSDLEDANLFFQTLRQRGYKVCLDDFGAGVASFQYLSVLDVDVVKVDGSAVKNAQKAPKGRAFLSALTELCRRMNVETIAEMVDTPQTLEFCRECGCNYVQGYLFGKPSREVKDFSPLPQLNLFRRANWRA